MRFSHFGAFGFFWLIVVLTACGDSLSAEEKELTANREKWESKGIEKYEFEYMFSCCSSYEPGFENESVLIAVEMGDINSVKLLETGALLDESEFFSIFYSVERLFELLQGALDHEVDIYSVRYDPLLGYPLAGDIDPDAQNIDWSEFSFTIISLQPR